MSGTITALRVQQGNKERVSVFLNDEYAFGVSVSLALGLRKGQQLTDAEIAHLQAEDGPERAIQQAARYLGYRPRSRAEVARYLRDKGFDEDAVDGALARLEQQGHLDDAAFARFWTENRARFRPRGEQALRYELQQKGVDRAVIDTALADLDQDDGAWSALEQRWSTWERLAREEFYRRAMGYLARRGFDYATARSACDRAWTRLDQRKPS